ncbi:MAG TPA: hypothetical protein VHQ47_18240 [Phycisphaerae bacterium]|nr:hypothetical protein [Phycisphaerae bacterium]
MDRSVFPVELSIALLLLVFLLVAGGNSSLLSPGTTGPATTVSSPETVPTLQVPPLPPPRGIE